MSQAEYRVVHRYREAIEIASGDRVFVDDVTFDPARHREIVAEPPAPRAPRKGKDHGQEA